ncbi:phenylalanyl-tRNA synthetase [Coemansia reversa NRRL 1564]|uniref:Phenylalanine--tRNA ligase, mitochondrial n=1 Tax=Coemansia reversa (strain ATCC 12441 / NRRL 1564) TaxID=763665 RepID=A0A2G5B360_COERN|nr:phenylalanyl-tRNA synthetase [Coemansia reversa NRRL 1564]|eukprot:PIA13436.1 phenylalanyl-tRNA synthetase [Coemansia reversa NRRL 1564]
MYSSTENGTADKLSVLGTAYSTDGWTNTTSAILQKTGRGLLHQASHPLAILKELIFQQFPDYAYYDSLSPVVTTQQNFDSLGFSNDHPGRAKSDTYYINRDTLLRTHTSAHQLQLLKAGSSGDRELLAQARNSHAAPGNERFLVAADVYRRDEIDASHYPVFHQMEGVCTFERREVNEQLRQTGTAGQTTTFSDSNPLQADHNAAEATYLAEHMKHTMNSMVAGILARAGGGQEGFPVRWIDGSFPFTSPSWEMEVLFRGEWLEICGCGITKQSIMRNAGMPQRIGWAFGFGLERLAMLLFGVPDIRLFWSHDPRFAAQFSSGKISTFKAFSRHPSCTKDVSFWIPHAAPFHENDLMDLLRETAGDLIEGTQLIDSFTHPTSGRTSRCYRITYCSMDRNVTNDEINAIQDRVRAAMVAQLGVTLR